MTGIDTSAAAFLAGLVTSVHCVGMCGPLSCSWAVNPQGGGFMKATGMYHAGRLLAYAVVGALAGMIGVVPLGFFQHGAGIVLPWLLVLAFAMVGIGLDTWLPKPRFLSAGLRRFQTAAFRMKSTVRAGLLGLGTPLLPCGPLYVMFALALACPDPAPLAGRPSSAGCDAQAAARPRPDRRRHHGLAAAWHAGLRQPGHPELLSHGRNVAANFLLDAGLQFSEHPPRAE
jgi:Cytochrome C biogenesis protein transmembrane region